MERVILVDASNLFYRTWYVANYKRNKKDYTANDDYVMHLFINSLVSKLGIYDQSSVLLFWDYGKSKFRTKLYPEYKANRNYSDAKTKKLMLSLRGKMYQYLPNLGMFQCGYNGVEADDLITYFVRLLEGDYDIIIYSGDGDFRQFPNTYVLGLDGNLEFISSDIALRTVFRKIVQGDRSDNIRGLKGYGPRTKGYEKLEAETGMSFRRMLAFASEKGGKEAVDRMLLNKELIMLKKNNNKIVTSKVKRKVDDLMRDYLRFSPSFYDVAATLNRLNLKELSTNGASEVIHNSNKATRALCRYTLGKRGG